MRDYYYNELEESSMVARWEAKWRRAEALDIARNMANLGFSMESVVSTTRLEPKMVEELYKSSSL